MADTPPRYLRVSFVIYYFIPPGKVHLGEPLERGGARPARPEHPVPRCLCVLTSASECWRVTNFQLHIWELQVGWSYMLLADSLGLPFFISPLTLSIECVVVAMPEN